MEVRNMREKAILALKASKTYYSITKPGIIFGNVVTAAAGFLLASRGIIDVQLFWAAIIGLSLIIASACVCNNTIDRRADAQMKRTKQRALARRLIDPRRAIQYASVLGLSGAFILLRYTSTVAFLAATAGFFIYVFAYSYSKYHSPYATWIGSLAGACPPVAGYTAVSGSMDGAALLLFFIVAAWQMPHFFAISIYRLEDYEAASIPVLPRIQGMLATKVHMLLYIVLFLVFSVLLPFYGYVGYGYLLLTLPLGLYWAYLAMRGFTCDNHVLWAKKMFFFSLAVVMGFSVAILLAV